MSANIKGCGDYTMTKLIGMENFSRYIRTKNLVNQIINKDEHTAIEIIKNRIELFFRKNEYLHDTLNWNVQVIAKKFHNHLLILKKYIQYIAYKYYLDILFGYNKKRALT